MDSSPVTTKTTLTTFHGTLQEAYAFLSIQEQGNLVGLLHLGEMGWGRESLGVQKKPLKRKKSLLRKVLHYLSSDTYMYSPMLSCPADPLPDIIFYPHGPSVCHRDSTSSSPPLNLDAWSLHFLEKSIPQANLDDWSVPHGALDAFTSNDDDVEFEAKCDLIEVNPRASINPNNVHPMVTRSKSGAVEYKAKEASPCISESSSEQTSTPSAAERTSKESTRSNSECTPKEAFQALFLGSNGLSY